MKKNFVVISVWLLAMFSISIANNVVLYKAHEFAYYYTLPGLKLVASVCIAEMLILAPASLIYFKVLLDKETYQKYFGTTKKGR